MWKFQEFFTFPDFEQKLREINYFSTSMLTVVFQKYFQKGVNSWFSTLCKDEKSEGNVRLTVWKNEKFTPHRKKSRQINYLLISLVKPLLSRNFCQKCVR